MSDINQKITAWEPLIQRKARSGAPSMDADEVAQDLRVTLWEFLTKQEDLAAVGDPLIYQVITWRYCKLLKKTMALPVYRLDTQISAGTSRTADQLNADKASLHRAQEMPSVEDRMQAHSMDQLYNQMVNQMRIPKHYREVLKLRYIDGMPPKAIAERQQVEAPMLVSRRLDRAKKSARKWLAAQGFEQWEDLEAATMDETITIELRMAG